jgi:hypothetical protein
MDAKTDLTNFWLAWHHTCAIRLCTGAYRKQLEKACATDESLKGQTDDIISKASEVIKATNAEFRSYLYIYRDDFGNRLSVYENEAAGWKDNGVSGSAFELMEGHLYAKGTINGRAFKDYLFEDIANRPGGMNRNLYGYMQSILRTMAKESFGENVYEAAKDENGEDIPPRDISLDGTTVARAEPTPEENYQAQEVIDWFATYLEKHISIWDDDKLIVLFCILNTLRVGSQKVQPLFSKGHDTINRYCNEMRAELLNLMRVKKGFSDKAIAIALNGRVQSILDKKMGRVSCFGKLKELIKENQRSTGK